MNFEILESLNVLMLIAQKLKKENIVEYLLYMWQTEDIIRACRLDIEIISERIILPFAESMTDDEKKNTREWYESLIDMMKREGVQEKGHLQLNKNTLLELDELHQNLLRSDKDASYPAKFYHILPFVAQLKKQQTDTEISDIEVCFNFLYGILLLRLKKAEISAETLQAQEEISKFMVLLARNWHADNTNRVQQ